jgi:hypothetical protein
MDYVTEQWLLAFGRARFSRDKEKRVIAERFFARWEQLKAAPLYANIDFGLTFTVDGESIPMVGTNGTDGPYVMVAGWISENTAPQSPLSPPVVATAPPGYLFDDIEWTDAVARQGVRIPRGDDYYQSTHWEILRSEGRVGRCAMCHRTDVATTLHHRTYERMGQERVDDLTEVCRACHRHYHAALRNAA